MIVQRFPDHETMSRQAADYLVRLIEAKPDALLCLGSGDTPIATYRQLVLMVDAGFVDVSACTFVGLDEWVGMDATVAGSCTQSLYLELFDPLDLRPDQIHVFNARATDLAAECRRMDALIDERGGFDLLLVGMGVNGHIALNEPGSSFTAGCHVSELHETTISVGQKYFAGPTALTQGITVGLRHVSSAHNVMMLVSGDRKAAILNDAITGPVTEAVPASLLHTHPQAVVMVDAAAARLLPN